MSVEHNFLVIYFTGVPVLKVDLGQDPKAIDVYNLFLTDNILHHIKKETNRYAKCCIEEKQRDGPLPRRSTFAT